MRQISDLLELLNRCVADNRIAALHRFLGAAGARPGPAGSPAQALPPMVHRADYQCQALAGAQQCEITVIRTDDRLLQVNVSLCYRWQVVFSPGKRAWRNLSRRARKLLGKGENFRVAGKRSVRYQAGETVALSALYRRGKTQVLDLKIGSGQFWA